MKIIIKKIDTEWFEAILSSWKKVFMLYDFN